MISTFIWKKKFVQKYSRNFVLIDINKPSQRLKTILQKEISTKNIGQTFMLIKDNLQLLIINELIIILGSEKDKGYDIILYILSR